MSRLAKLVASFAIFGTVSALAAPDQTAPATPPPTTAPAPAPAKQMSAGEMNVASANIEAQLEDDSQQVTRMQEIAKRAKDVIKLNCVNDRMVQLKAQRNVADELRSQLSSLLAKNSDDRYSLFQQLQSTADSAKDLREQARACIGESELYKQESGVTVEHPPTPDDPTIINPPIVEIEPPAYTSPFD